MSVFRHLPLGQRIPDCLHAVSCSLPTLGDLIGYEERHPGTTRHINQGYPRFVLHPCVRRLTDELLRSHLVAGQTLWLTASARSADELAAHLSAAPVRRDARVARFASDGLDGVVHSENADLSAEAKTFLQNAGVFLSSREAEDALVRRGLLPGVEPEVVFIGDARAEINRVLRGALPNAGGQDLFPASSGMNAVHAALRAVTAVQAPRGRTIWVQLGWLYRDTIALLRRHTSDPARNYIHLPDVFDFPALERLFAEQGARIAGVFAETPTNPLVQTPDIPALAALVHRHGARLVLDPSVASLFCVNVLDHADLVVASLTKYAAVEGDILAGLVAVNPAGPDAAALRGGIARTVEPLYARDLARLAVEIAGHERFVETLSVSTPRIARFLESHPAVKRVWWALAPESLAHYRKIARAPGAVGCMVSFTLNKPLAPVYDSIRLPKGPSFGMRRTLISPFLYIAHYDLVKDAAGRAELAANGLDPDLLRLSVGAEPVEDIIATLDEALGNPGA